MTGAELERLNARLIRLGLKPLRPLNVARQRRAPEQRVTPRIVRHGVGQVLGVR
jgi:hypothetical protein